MAAPASSPGSVQVLRQAQQGNGRALNFLFDRELPQLRRWAHTKVPRALWPRADVDDFVQLTVIRALRRYRSFESREGVTFQHYLRRILTNLVYDELRRARRNPETPLPDDFEAATAPTALDLLLGREARRRYRTALQILRPRPRAALVARLERGADYTEIARLIGAAGSGAARAVVARAVQRLVDTMRTLEREQRTGRRRPARGKTDLRAKRGTAKWPSRAG